MPQPEITDNAALHRFEMHEGGSTAFMVYHRERDVLRLIHTEVPEQLKGKGIGSRLVRAVLDLAQENRLHIVPVCPFVAQYLKRHPERSALVDPQYRWMIEAAE